MPKSAPIAKESLHDGDVDAEDLRHAAFVECRGIPLEVALGGAIRSGALDLSKFVNWVDAVGAQLGRPLTGEDLAACLALLRSASEVTQPEVETRLRTVFDHYAVDGLLDGPLLERLLGEANILARCDGRASLAVLGAARSAGGRLDADRFLRFIGELKRAMRVDAENKKKSLLDYLSAFSASLATDAACLGGGCVALEDGGDDPPSPPRRSLKRMATVKDVSDEFANIFKESPALRRRRSSNVITHFQRTADVLAAHDCGGGDVGKFRRWCRTFVRCDPRRAVADFFRLGDDRGPLGFLSRVGELPRDPPAAFFSVWRPTSREALRLMLRGEATGKSLNVKGKSAKAGRLSGFVPFVQIHAEEHKARVGTRPRSARITVYFRSGAARERAVAAVEDVLAETQATSKKAELMLQAHALDDLAPDVVERVLKEKMLSVADPRLVLHDDYAPEAFGVDMPERVFWETFVQRRDISRNGDWATGRPSVPAFMDANLASTRGGGVPKTVVVQTDDDDPLNPVSLLVAYAEARVLPVASDMDAFLFGSRGVAPEQLPRDQVPLVTWLLDTLEGALSEERGVDTDCWTTNWLAILKEEGRRGFHPTPPPYGWGDARTSAWVEKAVEATAACGAVRHGAECYNLYFPQELDDEYLVVWDGFPGGFSYVDEPGLRRFLLDRVAGGYAFPLNPKWVLADEGWGDVHEALRRSGAPAFFPADVLARLDAIRGRLARKQHPHARRRAGLLCRANSATSLDPDLALIALHRFITLHRAKTKLHACFSLCHIRGKLHAARHSPPPSPPRATRAPRGT